MDRYLPLHTQQPWRRLGGMYGRYIGQKGEHFAGTLYTDRDTLRMAC